MDEKLEIEVSRTSDVKPTVTAKPKKNLPVRILHSFKRRGDGEIYDTHMASKDDEESLTHMATTDKLSRQLKKRHMQMIATGGTIGTGLFIGSGSALATGGPLGLLLGFVVVASMVFCVVHALGELAVMFPVSGILISTRPDHERWIFSVCQSFY
jgi:yeast amino acid transporter